LLQMLTLALARAHAPEPEPTIGTVDPDYMYASPEAVENWHDMKFGLRIHWGLYSAQGIGPESWPLFYGKPGRGELGPGNASFEQWYYGQAENWSPTSFNAAEWIALMKRSGVKYFDFTAKHCDGFSMYQTDTKLLDCWDWDATGQRPPGIKPCAEPRHYSSHESFGRDVVGELIAAARGSGVLPGLYFSHADWHDPNLRTDSINPVVQGHVLPGCLGAPCDPHLYNRTSDPQHWRRGVLRHRAQLLEILTKYGEIFELSLDVGLQSTLNTEFNSDMRQTVAEMRAVAPNTLFRQRGIGGTAHTSSKGYGDYSTPEEVFPATGMPGNWQVIYHGSGFMSYDPDARNYVNGSFIVWHLVDIVAKGGQMQIGYGPDANGHFHPLAVEALEYTGHWLETNGEAIYYRRPLVETSGTQLWNDTASPQVRYTRSKDEAACSYRDEYTCTTIYAIVLSGFGLPPTGGTVPLADVVPTPGSPIYLLGYVHENNRTLIPVEWSQQGGQALLTVPVDIAGHPSIIDPGMTFVIRGRAAGGLP